MGTARSSLALSFAERYTALVIGTFGTMLIARLLTPTDIGIFSIGAVLVGLAQVLRDFGVGQYIIAAKTLGREQLRAALAVSIATAWSLALLIVLLSAAVADFYDRPELREVLRLLAINFLLVPFTSLTLSCLRRQLRLRSIYVINTSHSLTQLACTLWLASNGWGCLSLAWGTVVAASLAVLISLPLRPEGLPWTPSLRGVRAVLGFGAYATGGNVIDEAGVAAPDLIVGKVLGAEEVAVLGKAQAVLNLFNQAVTSAISPVLLPLFAAQARQGHGMRESYLLTVSCMTALAWPFFILLGGLALPAVRLLYGGQWDEAAPLIRIMCCAGALYSMFSMARYLFIATGRVREQARLDAAAVAVRVAALLPAAAMGLQWVAWAVVGGALFRCWLTWRYLAKLSAIDSAGLLQATWRSAALAILVSIAPISTLMTLPSGTAQLLAAVIAAVPLWFAGIVLLRHPLAGELELAWRKVRRRDAV